MFPGREESGRQVQDVEWIAYVGQAQWIALTANPHMCRTPLELDAIREHGARVFSLGSAQLPKEVKGLVFGRWWLSILRRSLRPEPCIWRIYFDKPAIKTIK